MSGLAPTSDATSTRTPPAGILPRPAFLSLWRDPIGFFTGLRAAHGDLAHTKIGCRDVYLLSHPELVHELLVTKQASFGKGYSLTRSKILLGDGLLTSEGDLHKQQRRRIQPAFHPKRISTYADVMVGYAAATGARWGDGDELDIDQHMMRLSQRIVAKTLLDADIEEAVARDAGAALDVLVDGFGLLLLPASHLLLKLPLPVMRRMQRARRQLDELILAMIAERRRTGDRGDVLSMLLFARDDGAGGMSDRQVRDEAMTLFLAGHDTTGNGLAWTWYLLSQNAAVEATWHAELDSVLGGRPPTVADLPRLTYTRQLFTESMRLYPPVWSVGRQARVDVELGGARIARGSVVQVCQWLTHRDARFFPDPERFSPERWTPDFERDLPRGAYFPFGLGPRLCIGADFAWMAGVLVLATLGQQFRMRLVPGHPVETLPRITLRPKYGLRMALEVRRVEA